jgi:hypothetical protein
MATDPEALTQLSRLLGRDDLRRGPAEALQGAFDAGFEQLVAGLLAEAAASDDVSDRASALEFLQSRLAAFATILDKAQRDRLEEALDQQIQAW